MAHNQLAENLDQISTSQLGFEFEDSIVWSKLEQRLDNRKMIVNWWMVAASVLIGLLLLPTSLLKEAVNETVLISQDLEIPASDSQVGIVSENEEGVNERPIKSIWIVNRKEIEPMPLAKVTPQIGSLEPILTAVQKENKPVFTGEDISIIQASLEQPKIGKGRTMTIRAQWQKSPTKSNVEHQALKIKLYEKQE